MTTLKSSGGSGSSGGVVGFLRSCRRFCWGLVGSAAGVVVAEVAVVAAMRERIVFHPGSRRMSGSISSPSTKHSTRVGVIRMEVLAGEVGSCCGGELVAGGGGEFEVPASAADWEALMSVR